MASYQKSTVRCAILLLLTSAPAFAANKTGIRPIAPIYGQIPLHFEANQGQTDSEVKFLSRGKGYTLFLTPTEAVLSLRKTMKVDKEIIPSVDEVGDPGTRTSTVRMKLIGADRDPKITGLEELPGRANYFIGSDPTKWRTDVPLYAKVKYKGVYPGIDLVYYGNQRQLEYDFVVAPGADPDVIHLGFEGSDHIRIDVSGDLVLETAAEEIRMRKPLVYQSVDDVRQEIAGEYVLLGQMEVGFQVGLYDAAQPLVIDPVLGYSTYHGGSGSDEGSGIAVDGSGNAYVTGGTKSTDFPTANALQPNFGGDRDVVVMKLSADGASLVYSTYLGGSGEDEGARIAVDESGSAYLTDVTDSMNFPTANALQPTFGGNWDAFVTKLSADGTSLVYSTYLGGSSSEGDPAVNEFLMGIAVDGSGNAYLSGWTDATDFPTANALQAVFGGGDRDALVAKLTASQKLQITHLGNGGGLQSDVVVFNPSSTTSATGEVNFFGDDGTPLDSSVFLPAGNSFTLQPLGSATLSTNGAGNLFTGSATVTSDTAISAVIRFDITGVGVAGVEASQVLTSAIAPVRRTGTLSSGVAFRNTGTSTIQVTLELKNENDDVVSGGTSTRTLAGNAKIAQFLEDLFPDAQTTTFTGTICVTAQSGQIAVIALELDFFNNVFTALPVAPFPPSQATAQSFAYITNASSGNVSVIDTTTNTVVATVTVGDFPHGVAVTPEGSRVYVVNQGSDNVSVIDTATNTVVDTVTVGTSPRGVAVHPDGSRVYVANNDIDTVSVIDTATNAVVATVTVGSTPRPVGQFIGPLSYKLHVAHFGNSGGLQSDVVVFNPSATATATGRIDFFDPEGTSLDSSGFLPGGNSFTLDSLGSATLSTTGAGSTVITGSATVSSDTPVSAVLRFDLRAFGAGIAGVEASPRYSPRPSLRSAVPVP